MSDDPLDQINRFVVVVLALTLIATATLVVALAWWRPDESIARINDVAGWLADRNNQDAKLVLTLGAGVAVLALLTVVVVELTPSDTQWMPVRNMKAGEAVVTTTQIAERIRHEVEQAPHVDSCEAVVAKRGKKVEVLLDLHVGPGADLAQTADEACRRAHELVAEQMGIALASRPRARLHYRELRLRRGEPRQPPQEFTGWERPASKE